jgi:hypothetical protein
MRHLNGVGATSACLREAASAKAGRPKGPASRDPTQQYLRRLSCLITEGERHEPGKPLASFNRYPEGPSPG